MEYPFTEFHGIRVTLVETLIFLNTRKQLAYPHLKWVNTCYMVIFQKGLHWSPLLNMKGSCFVTVYDKNSLTYSYFDWEEIKIICYYV